MEDASLHRRLRDLPRRYLLGRELAVARGRVRLLGLAGMPSSRAGAGLLIPRCAAVHTFGMRFVIDVVFLDRAGMPLDVRRAVGPGRFLSRRGAAAVAELPAPGGNGSSA